MKEPAYVFCLNTHNCDNATYTNNAVLEQEFFYQIW